MLVDLDRRKRVLTDLDTTFLVEAAAGTGKTSLMAGRVAMLLACGVQPKHVAAITFTELAAAELAQRIRSTVEELLKGDVPDVLVPVLPLGLSSMQRDTLLAAAHSLDDLTATTIHGLCHTVIRSHAIAAGLDPGFKVMDAPTTEVMRDSVFSHWLADELSETGRSEDPIAVLSRSDPLKIASRLRKLGALRQKHPTARPLPMPAGHPDIDFVDAVGEFARWLSERPGDGPTAKLVADLEKLAAFYTDALAGNPSFAELWRLASPQRVGSMRRDALELEPYQRKTAWKKAYGGEDGARFNAQAEGLFRRADNAYRTLLGHIGQALITATSAALDSMIDRYAAQKRAAAVLDYDDLLLYARKLVVENEDVRLALARRYRHVCIDEFQDTDPIQAEILFYIGAEARPSSWTVANLRPGSLFFVGDPKQAIFRFRGADLAVYEKARKNVTDHSGGEVVQITANFRSRPGVIDYVNNRFEPVLMQSEQPGYVPLSHTQNNRDDALPSVAKLTVVPSIGAKAGALRDEEAAAVAKLCKALIGAFEVTRGSGPPSPLRPGDIALLAPTGTELWRYERALEAQGITVSSQAGKSLMRQQETQDVLTLLRALADSRDTLAFGALIRGPLVGLTDDEILQIAESLPEGRNFTIRTEPASVAHPLARAVLEKLGQLRRLAPITTPLLILSDAIEKLHVRVVMAARHRNRSARALANIDALIERARAYDVGGLQSFVQDLQRDWEFDRPLAEGRSDASEEAVDIVTMHSSKGLEWSVVIPVNTATLFLRPEEFVHRRSDNTLHWVLGEVAPPQLAAAREEEIRNVAHERERLWYVACTRARDLLVVPCVPSAKDNSWCRIMDLGHDRLPEIDLAYLPEVRPAPAAEHVNEQTAERFAVEAERVVASAPPIAWRRPSDHDPDRVVVAEGAIDPANETGEVVIAAGAGRLRGMLLHKIMEEFLTSELGEDEEEVIERAGVLLGQLVANAKGAATLPDPAEVAVTALRALRLPEIATLRARLLPELAVWSEHAGALIAGRADAVAYDGEAPDVVLDWKSDVAPSAQDRAQYRGQLQDYMTAIGAPRGAVVYVSLGEVAWV